MKRLLTILLIILSFGEVKAQENINFYLHENRVTIMCPDASNGETGIIDGVEYTKRTREQITVESAATTCTSGIEDMTDIFYYKRSFNGDISHWDVSSTTNMGYIFSKTPFNQGISEWDVSSVNDMDYMFNGASAFNQNLKKWCVSFISTDPKSFSNGSPLTEENKPKWGTCPSN